MSVVSGLRILIVEDEPDSMEVVVKILRHHNIESYGVYSAEEALTALKESTPTLAIVDLALPQMSGWELLRVMRSNPTTAHIPIVAITAYHSIKVADEAIQAGFDAYFPKPIDMKSFVDELERIVSGA